MVESKHAILVQSIKDCGGISKAAKYLNMSQSALSHQLKKAEVEMGVKLFDRKKNRLLITEAGEAVYDYALTLDDENKRLAAKLKFLRGKLGREYVHGYSNFESDRLINQANSISEFIHYDSTWPEGDSVLEVGCGVGAQTKILAAKNPSCSFTSIDISGKSIAKAKADPELAKMVNVDFVHLDVFDLKVLGQQFDHIFICFVLEHLADPVNLLQFVGQFLKSGGTVTVIEGDHGSAYFHPESVYADKAIAAQVSYQNKKGGNANIGREVFALLSSGNFSNVSVSPRCIYVDDNNGPLKESFIIDTFTAMIEGMKNRIVAAGVESEMVMSKGINDLKLTNQKNGTFSYTFFKGIGTKS